MSSRPLIRYRLGAQETGAREKFFLGNVVAQGYPEMEQCSLHTIAIAMHEKLGGGGGGGAPVVLTGVGVAGGDKDIFVSSLLRREAPIN